MKATQEAGLLVAACLACCAPLVVGAAALFAPPVLLASGAVAAVGAGLAGIARRRQIASERDTVVSADPGNEAGRDAPA